MYFDGDDDGRGRGCKNGRPYRARSLEKIRRSKKKQRTIKMLMLTIKSDILVEFAVSMWGRVEGVLKENFFFNHLLDIESIRVLVI